jgi:putative ABC transport system permease protein
MAASIILIIGISGIFKQMKYMTTYNIGMDTENIIIINNGHKISDHYAALKTEFKKSSLIKEVSCSNSYPFNWMSTNSYTRADSNDQFPYPFQFFRSDKGFLNVFNIKMEKGRWFSEEYSNDKNAIILNEVAVSALGLNNPVGEEFYKTDAPLEKYHVIGVVSNFNFRSLHHIVEPLLLRYLQEGDYWRYIEIKGTTPVREKLISEIKSIWNEVSGNEYMDYTFLEDQMVALYAKEMKIKESIGLFCVIAMLISCFGLLGTVLNTTTEKTKEIGIRKINGAKIIDVLILINLSFVKRVGIAFLIASPIAWYAMHAWLQNFAYRTDLSWWIFLLSGTIALGIALLTVSWRSWWAATRNPVEALRYE